jgi:hypothetical protein
MVVIVAGAPLGAGTTTGTDSRNVHGRAIAITVFSTVKPWGKLWLPIVFLGSRLWPRSQARLAELSFIHFARWTLVRRIPYNGPPQPRRRLRFAHLFFESNFNGGWEEYIDAFSYILTRDMRTVWGSSYGFPNPLPAAPFKAYIRRNELQANHYYSAYPEATTTMVLAGLELTDKLAALRRRAADMDPDAFATAWADFLGDAQRCL